MTSMRIDGDKSAKVWAKRLKNLVQSAEADGVFFTALETAEPNPDLILVYKEGAQGAVELKYW